MQSNSQKKSNWNKDEMKGIFTEFCLKDAQRDEHCDVLTWRDLLSLTSSYSHFSWSFINFSLTAFFCWRLFFYPEKIKVINFRFLIAIEASSYFAR